MTQTLNVALGARSYPIHIGNGALDDAAIWRRAIAGRHVLVVSNTTVAPLYLARVQAGLEGFEHQSIALPDGEAYKSLAQAERIFDALAAMGASRDATILALGGGVIGDLAGFAAACWMRGIDFVQMPTTLLAMVDSSVGGKTAVNLPAGKNLVGAFHQPKAVIADTGTLATLPDREYRAGLAEIVKHSALGDAEYFARLEALAQPLAARDEAALAEVIAHSCAFKAGVVARDETERGERALLNFGHTFGHALEAECGYGTLLHGEAVAIGMGQAARLSQRLGLAGAADAERLQTLLDTLGLPTAPPAGLAADALLGHMKLDKKNHGGTLRFILWRGIGRAEIVDAIDPADVRAVLG
ncbi:3-dehydroquinate synthase [Oleiagrimonas sp. C23AA]|uniref:3-dehydroquinate synthase n=1 Tax=Oleiagrimonas sp. C23AA TaxID=2719047 RepID=UPI00141E31A6|nr:3-dehydroquinate synthase [Oleiagrimonas sp. C23AA]NII12008.1 3-dehydroquinate synthase [Oleiagrimonas sp. C23AA]